MTASSPPSGSNGPASTAFEHFHEGVRRWIWDQGWTALRPIQERAAEPILRGDADVIIAAPTAGGKTEAAFLPIASRLAETRPQSLGCLCVSPLKALINDQADRLRPLFDRIDLPLTPWHGDVSRARKDRLLQDREGVLLITPESLEALFVVRGTRLPPLIRDLRYVVIDELHCFIGRERGRQLQSLLHRVELAVRRRIPRIALSATLGDMRLAAEVLRPGAGSSTVLIEGERDGREIRMQLRGYRQSKPAPVEPSAAVTQNDVGPERLVIDLFEAIRGTDNLVFANSRQRVEELTHGLRELAELRRVPSEFFAHHGSLSREIREEAEQRIKDRSRPASIVCTTTLELGIDIGSVSSIAQVGTPPSVAALRQRLGRSGRRGNEAAVLRIFITEDELDANPDLIDELRVELVQSIAMIQLLLARWCEPPSAGQLHLSTLVQQVLSIIAQHGAASAVDLYRALCQSGPFGAISSDLFGRVLRGLGRVELLTQTSDGGLTLGIRGEQVVDHYSFYASFVTPEEYRLVSGSKTLGSIPIDQPLAPGSHLIFAGRRWEVRSIDDQARVIDLLPAKGGRPPRFESGGIAVHDRVREEMLRIYASSTVPVYLDAPARDLLNEGRRAFERWDLGRVRILERGENTYLFPWQGDKVLHTLSLQLRAHDLASGVDGIAVVLRRADQVTLRRALTQIAQGTTPSGPDLAQLALNQVEEKYDWTLDPDVRSRDYASRHFDEAASQRAAALLLSSARDDRMGLARD